VKRISPILRNEAEK